MPLSLSRPHAPVWALLVGACLSMAACGASGTTGNGEAKDYASAERTEREATNAANSAGCPGSDEPADIEADARDALEADARAYAKDEGIPVDEARRRLRVQQCFTDDVADLERALRNEEANTFAGLWSKRPPGHGYVVLFTRDGEQTIRPYLEGAPERFRRLIEARSGAEATAAELEAAQREVGRLFDRLKIGYAASGTNLKKNRVEIYVKDRAQFEAALREGGARLPEHVAVVESGLCCLRPD